ncbi:DegV family protein [Eubacterium sp. 1001713B170207_170306_E7]|uniref:DegV family protein n=1 Tax=Eubacterium sp. 1001713B170207_170306_E7 TaxID=2787097 RepID=UPI001898D4CF|nr:DegV family protein [Eubacterium sp. 1001713B170207_170306_E7]
MENKIIVDSCLDFNPEVFTADLPLVRIPFKLRIDDEELVDHDLSTMLLVDKMKLSKNKVSTACPSPQEYLDAIDPQCVNYIITISSKLSGSYNSAVMAAVMAQEKYPDCQVHVLDSESAAAGEDLIFMKLKAFLEDNMPSSEIVAKLVDFITSMRTMFILNSLDNLAKNGRISSTMALLGKVLKVVPIMTDNGEGEIALKEKVRGKKKAFSRLVEIIADEVSDASEKILAIAHVHAQETAENLKKAIEEKCNFKDVVIFEAGGLSTVYADNGGVIVAY